MSSMRNMWWTKLKTQLIIRIGKSRKEGTNNMVDKSNVCEKYLEAFRTKSYNEMCNKVQGQLLERRSCERLESSSPYTHLSEFLLEPSQETLVDIVKNSNLHQLIINYLETSLDACNTCGLVLRTVHQARANHHVIKKVIELTKNAQNDDQWHVIYRELDSFASTTNPFSILSSEKFLDIHNSHRILLEKLTSKGKKVRRRAKFTRWLKRLGWTSLVVCYIGIVTSFIVIMIHSMVGIVVAPGLIGSCSLGLVKKWYINMVKGGLETSSSSLERLNVQLEVAAKGIYTLINDFDTMSRLVNRLNDEVEHTKLIADKCVRTGIIDVMKEVVREFGVSKTCFLAQLEELEEHINLCFLNVNRSRRLITEEIMVIQPEH